MEETAVPIVSIEVGIMIQTEQVQELTPIVEELVAEIESLRAELEGIHDDLYPDLPTAMRSQRRTSSGREILRGMLSSSSVSTSAN